MSYGVVLNVGGVLFATTRETLCRRRPSFLAGLTDTLRDEAWYAFVDRDPTHFRHVLNHLRGCAVSFPSRPEELRQLAEEADFYALDELAAAARLRASSAWIRNSPS